MTDQNPVYIHSMNGMYTMKVVNHKEQLKAAINMHDPVYTAKEVVVRLDNTHNINDLACNNITIGVACEGSVQIITHPPGATIFIDGDRQQITTPAIIDHILCTDPINKPNKFRLTLPGYRDKEGILPITSLNIPESPYILDITMEIVPNEIGGLLIVALTIGAFMFFFQIEKEKKYKEITE